MKVLTAAIQFGSARICSAAALYDPSGNYEVLAIESVNSDGCIQHGCVTNVEDTAMRIKSLMQKLSNRVNSMGHGVLDKAYIGLCGMSMHSVEKHPYVLVDESYEITPKVLEQLEEQSRTLVDRNMDVLGLKSNGQRVEGQQARGDHQVIVAEKRLLQGYLTAMKRAGIKVAGVFATPLLLGDILTVEEKQKGCLLVDFGAQLTTLSIYYDNQLRHLTVLPFGSDSVTHDIASQGRRIKDAEELKINFSDASSPKEVTQDHVGTENPIAATELNLIVSSRYEEILANIDNQIQLAGFKNRLEGGCVLTGGASLQRGLPALVRGRLGISKINTRSCSNIRYGSSERKPYLASIMTLLSYCTENCETTEKPVIIPPKQGNGEDGTHNAASKKTGVGFRSFLDDLFSGADENE